MITATHDCDMMVALVMMVAAMVGLHSVLTLAKKHGVLKGIVAETMGEDEECGILAYGE